MSLSIIELATVLDQQWSRARAAITAGFEERQAVATALAEQIGEAGRYALREWDAEPCPKLVFLGLRWPLEVAMRGELARRGTPIAFEMEAFDDWSEEPPSWDSGESEPGARFRARLAYAAQRSFKDIAERMLAHFNPANATRLALEEAANKVFEYFRPSNWKAHKVEIEARRDRRVITHGVWADGYTAWQMNYDYANRLIAILRALSILVAHSTQADAVTSEGLEAALLNIGRRQYSSRMRLELGPGLELVFFKEKLEFVFSDKALEAVQLVIAQHRTVQGNARSAA